MIARSEDETYHQKLILGITTTLLCLCYILYFFRILSRKLLQAPLWIDDWFMLFALVGTCTPLSSSSLSSLAGSLQWHECFELCW